MTMGVGGYTEGRSFKKVIKKSMRGKKLTGNRKECRKATNGLFLGFLHLSFLLINFGKRMADCRVRKMGLLKHENIPPI